MEIKTFIKWMTALTLELCNVAKLRKSLKKTYFFVDFLFKELISKYTQTHTNTHTHRKPQWYKKP